MAIAISSFPNLFEALLGWLARPQPAPLVRVPLHAPVRAADPPPVQRAPLKPLRVVRVLEPTAPRSTAGRMVISGRMADVCAELDRLAAQESRGH
jgi:hypothetical protein